MTSPSKNSEGRRPGGERAGGRLYRRLRAGWRAEPSDALALLFIATFFVSFFGWVFLSDKYLVGGDAFVESYPLRTLFWDSLKRGSPLLWLPHIFSGYPSGSMAQMAVGYPVTWGYLFLAGHRAEQAFVLAPFLLAPLFTYAYARTVGRGRLAALLAGLCFGYGGLMLNAAGVVGMATNSFAWLPLVLIGIEQAGRGNFRRGLLWAAGAYSMSVLAGHGQSFLFVGLVAVLYGACYTACALGPTRRGLRGRVLSAGPWLPLLAVLGAGLLAAGVAAFQILETRRAVQLSIRARLSYETFSEGSFSPDVAFASLLSPLYYYRDVTPYVAPLAILLAALALYSATRQAPRDWRVFFWASLAALGWALMLGENTPAHKLAYRLPLVNQFRMPSRHCFEWTFAVSVLAAYGWDAAAARRRAVADGVRAGRELRVIIAALTALAVAAAVGFWWWRATGLPPSAQDFSAGTGLAPASYLLWKAAFTVLTLTAAWLAFRLRSGEWRGGLLLAAVALTCFTEPYLVVTRFWAKFAKPEARFNSPSEVTRLLLQHSPEEHRVYTRVNLFVEELSAAPRLDPPNLTALYGLHNVAGYQSLILERYSRALGNVRNDAVNPRPYFPPDDTLFTGRSQVLDLLNTSFVVAFSNLGKARDDYFERDGVEFAVADLGLTLPPRATQTLSAFESEADAISIVSSLSGAGGVKDGAVVGLVRVVGADGRAFERQLRAGEDTAEWAHERADVRAAVPHRRAPVFDSSPGGAAHTFSAYRYWARARFAERLRVARVELSSTAPEVTLNVSKVTLFDTATARSTPLTAAAVSSPHVDPEHWEEFYNQNQTLVLRNRRALPRAWLVSEAEAVDGEEALRRIRGEGGRDFDPRRTALLEVAPERLPRLPGGPVAPGSAARVSYGVNRMSVHTSAPADSLLVVSEVNYPGWAATVDDAPAEIFVTDYLLRGVFVPAGAHRVEFRYAAPMLRAGAVVSALTLLFMLSVALFPRRRGGGDDRRRA